MTAIAAGIFVLLALGVALFQAALVCGAPWGELTMGGRVAGRLPWPLRVVAFVSLLLLLAFAVIVAARAQYAIPALHEASRWLVWVVVGYCALGVVANGMTRSRRERRLWLPVVILMLASSALVATA